MVHALSLPRSAVLACGSAIAIMLSTALPSLVHAQAQTSLLSVSVAYNTRKAMARPDASLKARLDSLDAEIAGASRSGNTNELRRLYAKGSTLLAGRPWTDSLDLSTSLRLRTDRGH